MKRGILSLLAVSIVATGAAWAQVEDPNVGAIYLCNEVALRIRVPAGGLSVDQRREAVRLRIVRAYATEAVTASNIRLSPQGNDWVIAVGRTTLLTVTEADARANGTTTAALAQAWAARLRDLMPRCKPQPLPPGR
ncbi:hypothetical protein HRbin32_00993 [bacterium HR32]|jgi:hypothetical protein|nr:hypothetical protein HRbin32_00993 [bacterium HR32]